jgi:hypothetical protein
MSNYGQQPPYGQNPYGQPPNPYGQPGQPYGQPSRPAQPCPMANSRRTGSSRRMVSRSLMPHQGSHRMGRLGSGLHSRRRSLSW